MLTEALIPAEASLFGTQMVLTQVGAAVLSPWRHPARVAPVPYVATREYLATGVGCVSRARLGSMPESRASDAGPGALDEPGGDSPRSCNGIASY